MPQASFLAAAFGKAPKYNVKMIDNYVELCVEIFVRRAPLSKQVKTFARPVYLTEPKMSTLISVSLGKLLKHEKRGREAGRAS